VGLLLAKRKSLHLGVADGTDGLGVLLEHIQVTLDGFLAILGFPTLGGLGESLLFAGEPVFVESSSDLFGKMSSPDGLDGSWSIWSVDVTSDTNDLESRGFNDGNRFNNLLLVDG